MPPNTAITKNKVGNTPAKVKKHRVKSPAHPFGQMKSMNKIIKINSIISALYYTHLYKSILDKIQII